LYTIPRWSATVDFHYCECCMKTNNNKSNRNVYNFKWKKARFRRLSGPYNNMHIIYHISHIYCNIIIYNKMYLCTLYNRRTRLDDLFSLRLFTFDFNDICTAGTAVILFDSDHKYKVLNIHISRVYYNYIIPEHRVQIPSWLCG